MIAAIIPACGRSTRMGRPKLTLPIDGTPLIARVVDAMRRGGVDLALVVAPPDEVEGAARTIEEAERAGAVVLVAEAATADMRATVELGLDRVRSVEPPATLVLCPADAPGLSAGLVSRLLEESRRQPDRIILPTFRGKRGHPLVLPWSIAELIPGLPAGMGVNALLARFADRVTPLDVEDPGATADLDTPADYETWRGTGPDSSD